MATYVPPQGTTFTIYTNGNFTGSPSDNRYITSITDNNATDDKFTSGTGGDTITITLSNGGRVNIAKFLGVTSEIEGGPYLVFQFSLLGSTLTYVVGTGPTAKAGQASAGEKEAPSTVSALNINSAEYTVCFFPGTLIATPSGERKIEELFSGDLVSVGDSRVVPVKWVGRQSVSTLFCPAERLMPVRFSAGSLGGEGGQLLQPHSDLTVTPDHAMLVDGVLCEAGALVNGTTITRVPLSEFGESYMVYHIETEAHEIILANGALSETFIDNVSRRAFDNYDEFEALHGDLPTELKELPYPRAANDRHLPLRIKNHLGIIASTKPVKIA